MTKSISKIFHTLTDHKNLHDYIVNLPVVAVLFAMSFKLITCLKSILDQGHIKRELLQALRVVVQDKPAKLSCLLALDRY